MKAQLTPEQRLKKRTADAYKTLFSVARQKTPSNRKTMIYGLLGANLGVTGGTVFNYMGAKPGHKGDGYFIDALIEEFNKLPDVPALKIK